MKPDRPGTDPAPSETAFGEPRAPYEGWPRYTDIPFPRYRYVPGLNPHPRKNPKGHSYGQAEIRLSSWNPEEWRKLAPYLFGVDLYNYAYWWECHEVLEGLWQAVDRKNVKARFLQGIIQIAAANLHRHMEKQESAGHQLEKGIANLAAALTESPVYMGMDIAEFIRDSRGYFSNRLSNPAMIRLHTDLPSQG